jgi:heme/copper-type cytochrome/quinol oxidase subunit 3
LSLISILVLAIRAFEFTTLNVRWDQNAYGSIVWVLLGLHTTHILTDAIDTVVLTALMFTRHAKGKRFADTEDNGFYWDFVVLSWLPFYGLIYWVSRM